MSQIIKAAVIYIMAAIVYAFLPVCTIVQMANVYLLSKFGADDKLGTVWTIVLGMIYTSAIAANIAAYWFIPAKWIILAGIVIAIPLYIKMYKIWRMAF